MSASSLWTFCLSIFIIYAVICNSGIEVRASAVDTRPQRRNDSTPPVEVLNSTECHNGSDRTTSIVTPDTSGSQRDGKMPAGAVAGVVIAALIVVIATTMGSFFIYRWRKKKTPKRDIRLPSANMPSRESKDIDHDIPTENAPPPPKHQFSFSNRPPRPVPPHPRAKSQRSIEPDNMYESYEDNNSSSRPMSYEEPMAKVTSPPHADDKAPRRPPRPKRDKNRFVEVSLDDSVDSNASRDYDDVNDDDRDSYETPIAKHEEHTYRAMFESSIKSDEYYNDVNDN